tara:strand:+ start:903 stop:2636 length:1734 start_codon:yes stop_codon:yes gene_type:complete
MAKSRILSFPTSPRVPSGVFGDLILLKQLENRVWDNETQLEYAKLLSSSESYKGVVSKKETAFAARDRTRTPKLLGLIKTHLKGKEKGILKFTEMGNRFLEKRSNHKKLFERQLLKVQYPNPNNCSNGFEEMNIRPMVAVIQILLDVEKLTRTEFKIFVVSTTHHKKIQSTISEIKKYRATLSELSGNERRLFKEDTFNKKVREVFSSDIAEGNIKIRESNNDFIKTKKNNMKDMGDAGLRLMLETGVFTLIRGQLCIAESRIDEAKYYLNTLGSFKSEQDILNYHAYVDNYQGSSKHPALLRDNSDLLKKLFLKLNQQFFGRSNKMKDDFLKTNNVIEKEKIFESMENEISRIQREKEEINIQENSLKSFKEIKEQYLEICDRKSDLISDVRPVYFEWNTWRSFIAIGDYKDVIGNFITDTDGIPANTASGKMPDLIVEYENFWLVVEVTLQSGMKQYESEHESITRHVGKFQKDVKEKGDEREVYGFFIAPNVNDTILPFLQVYAKTQSDVYGGKVRIAPLDLEEFIQLTSNLIGKENPASKLDSMLQNIFSDETLSKNSDVRWKEYIKDYSRNI